MGCRSSKSPEVTVPGVTVVRPSSDSSSKNAWIETALPPNVIEAPEKRTSASSSSSNTRPVRGRSSQGRGAKNDAQSEGHSGLLRAMQTINEASPRRAGTPRAALEAFFSSQEVEVPEQIQERMWTTFKQLNPEKFASEVIQLERDNTKEKVEAEHWDRFACWCIEQLMKELFELVDQDADGLIGAQDLMTMLVLISSSEENAECTLDPKEVELTLQEFDIDGKGCLSLEEFMSMVHALEREADYEGDGENAAPELPHLVLHLDVNNTVLMSDSITSSGAKDLLNTTLAGCSWGVRRTKGKEDTWIKVCPEPKALPPWKGLLSYAEFVDQKYPTSGLQDSKAIKAQKNKRRQELKSFCELGHPGESLRPHIENLISKLQLEADVAGSATALAAGLHGASVQLLPSFFHMLRELKRAKRTFSIAFRTFGSDLNEKFEQEFNAFCEGRHPLFPGGPVLDGSDGYPDHRMNLRDDSVMGTLWRDLETDTMALIWGTHLQPEDPEEQALKLGFWSNFCEMQTHLGLAEAAQALTERLLSQTRTVALRDYYHSWAKAGFKGMGGKPVFLQVEDRSVFPVFFDDHIRPTDPSIVDPIDVREYPRRVPMAQVFDIHLIRVSPLRSISERCYFYNELMRCEKAKMAQLARRRKVANLLYSVKSVRSAILMLGGGKDDEEEEEEEDENAVDSFSGDAGDDMVSSGTQATRSSFKNKSKRRNGRLTLHPVAFTPWNAKDEVAHCAPLDPEAMEPPPKRQEEAFGATGTFRGDMAMSNRSHEILNAPASSFSLLAPSLKGNGDTPKRNLLHACSEGRIIEFPLTGVSKVYRIVKNDDRWYSAANNTSTSSAPPNAEHIVVVEFMRRKLAFVFKSLQMSQRFLMCMELLIRRAQQKQAKKAMRSLTPAFPRQIHATTKPASKQEPLARREPPGGRQPPAQAVRIVSQDPNDHEETNETDV